MKTQKPTLAVFTLWVMMLSQVSYSQWTQQGPKLVGTGAVGNAAQGSSVSVSADGNTAIVGAIADNTNAGAAWVFTRSGGVWTQQGPKLVGTGAVGGAQQGISVSISADGNTAIVGGYGDNNNAGAAWVFTRSGGVWTQQGNKLVGTGAVGNARQGSSVSISADGNTAIVGGFFDNSSAGAAWVFTRSSGLWTQQGPKLVGTGAVGNAEKGRSVFISADGNTAIVGGPGDNSRAGAAWVFTRSSGLWTQQGNKLVGTGAVGNSYQGFSVSISADGNTAIVGGFFDNSSAGAAWVFTRSSGLWTQQGPKLVGTGAVGNAEKGRSVFISADGNTAIVGGPGDNSRAGAAWVFTRSSGLWTQQGNKLVGTGAVGNSYQGFSVSISADGNTAIVGGYGDNSNAGAAWIFSKVALSIVRPQPGERWIAGDQDTIRWTGGRANQFVDFQLSTDSGATYATIDFAIPADSGKYIWLVPDSLTTRAKIRLLDTATNDTLAVSDTFKIKRYSLTRLNAIGHYEEFSPPVHGWSFANADSNFWPVPWWVQFQYSGGIDRHTGQPYDPMFPAPPIFALPAHFVDWPVYVDVFGRDSCYWSSSNTYRPDMVNHWRTWKTLWNGSCFGVVQSGMLYFHYRDQFRQRHPSVPLTNNLASITTMTDSIRIVINRYFAMQYGKVKRDHDIANASTSPRQTLQAIRQMWANDSTDDDAGLRYRDPAGSGGHAVIPYRLQRNPLNPVQFRLFVCNSNSPASVADFILIDSLANTWQEFTGFGWGQGTVLMYLYPPAIRFFSRQIRSTSPLFAGLPEAGDHGGGGLEISSPGRSDVRVLNSSGDSIGVRNGNSYNTMANAYLLDLDTGHPQPPLGYLVPEASYRIQITNPVDSTVSVSVRADSVTISYARGNASAGQRDEIRYDNRLVAANPDAASKSVNFQLLVTGENHNKVANLTTIALVQNDSISTGMDDGTKPRLMNYGIAKDYSLRLQHFSASGIRQFASPMHIPFQTTHIIAPNWDSLATTNVRIYVDLGNNGTIDDTLIVINTVDVDDRGDLGVPQEYNLAQNYPNPFNPTTRIEYALPHASRVRLTVYNVLGQFVATLVDGDQPAGRFTAEWNGTTANGKSVGSGVYLYTMTAQAANGGQVFVHSGKMMLMR